MSNTKGLLQCKKSSIPSSKKDKVILERRNPKSFFELNECARRSPFSFENLAIQDISGQDSWSDFRESAIYGVSFLLILGITVECILSN